MEDDQPVQEGHKNVLVSHPSVGKPASTHVSYQHMGQQRAWPPHLRAPDSQFLHDSGSFEPEVQERNLVHDLR